MKRPPLFALGLGFWLFWALLAIMPQAQAQSQQTYTDHKPQYRPWKDNYILDKIEYRQERTVFYFRFVSSGGGVSAIFYPPGGKYPWYLKANDGKNYELKEIRNVRRNGITMAQAVRNELRLESVGSGNTVFSCEVHFERLPNNVTKVDLIEGRGKEYDQNHFNCFNVAVKTFKDPELGTEADSDEAVRRFEQKFGVRTPKPKPKPKPEPKKPEPVKPEPVKPEPVKPEPVKPEPEPVVAQKQPKALVRKGDLVCGENLVLSNLSFRDNSEEFTSLVHARQTLDLIFDYMREHTESKLVVMGHTDVFGNKERNKELSRKRALKIQQWLISNGIPSRRIETQAYGSERPLFPEGSEKNRRVEVNLSCD